MRRVDLYPPAILAMVDRLSVVLFLPEFKAVGIGEAMVALAVVFVNVVEFRREITTPPMPRAFLVEMLCTIAQCLIAQYETSLTDEVTRQAKAAADDTSGLRNDGPRPERGIPDPESKTVH